MIFYSPRPETFFSLRPVTVSCWKATVRGVVVFQNVEHEAIGRLAMLGMGARLR